MDMGDPKSWNDRTVERWNLRTAKNDPKRWKYGRKSPEILKDVNDGKSPEILKDGMTENPPKS